MPGTGYYDKYSNTYNSLGTQTWSSYATWSAFTSWQGTPSSTLTYTSIVQDTGTVDWFNLLTEVQASLPVTTVIRAGTAVDSAGAIVTLITTTIHPNTATVSAVYGRYFEVDITLTQDSAGEEAPIISNVDLRFNNRAETISRADINTSTLTGSVGQRNLTFDINVGKIKNILTQAHTQSLGDSAQDSEVPIVLVDKSSTPVVLNIYDADSYGKRRRIDCRLDVQAQYLPLVSSDINGNIREI